MTQTISIGLIGDFNPEVKAHQAIPQAIALAAESLGCRAEASWLATRQCKSASEDMLASYDALWCVPGSPYENMEGALRAIQVAREYGVPFLGTCAGFHHALIEYARNVLGLAEADHTESNPDATLPLIAPLACSLVEQEGTIFFRPGSRIAAIYGTPGTVEQYHCSFGLNPRYQSVLEQGGIQITGVDSNGEARSIELLMHPFFIGTLFQPERSAFRGVVHPLIKAFIQAARDQSKQKEQQPPDSRRINKIRWQPPYA